VRDRSDEEVAEFFALLEQLSRREDVPLAVRRLARTHHEALLDLKEAAEAGQHEQAKEIVRNFAHTLPVWAREPGALDALAGIVTVDETASPVAVTVYWERVPRKLRRAAASLASALVDFYDPPAIGGRPRRKGGPTLE
jgi:uncharacterized protein (UPF0147 family)